MRSVPRAPVEGLVFDVDTFAVHDGPGIRMSVYMKGCSLRCLWCHSPESQSASSELIFMRDRCALCGVCAVVCSEGVHSLNGGGHAVLRERCAACGRCVLACPRGALALRGYPIAADDLVERAARMRPFFDRSGGGVTLTGGEPTQQPEFAEAFLAGCRARGIHTALETCGACAWAKLERLLDHVDLLLYDLKLIDDAEHRRWTGTSNRRVLANARRLAGRPVQVRVPLIPDITDTEANVRGIFDFMRDAGLGSVCLLPYNASASAKYEWLGRDYAIEGELQDEAHLAPLVALAGAAGLEVAVG
jgi:pyruvate formate lyase activating enzyme